MHRKTPLSNSDSHNWLRKIEVAAHRLEASQPPCKDPADLDAGREVIERLLRAFERLGHAVASRPGAGSDIVFTQAPFLVSIPWRRSLFFTGRIRYRLPKHSSVVTTVAVSSEALQSRLDEIAAALRDESSARNRAALCFDGLLPQSREVLSEQGRRAGPIVALARAVQAQAKCIRILLVAHDGKGAPQAGYLFDLVGAHPRFDLASGDEVYEEIAIRLATAVSAREATDHVVEGETLSPDEWQTSPSVRSLVAASRELGSRGFFADPVVISSLVKVPVVGSAISEQYSEGCFATYAPEFDAQIVTATGSSKAVHKGRISPDDLVLVTGVRGDWRGALVRPVKGRKSVIPSSEAVELYAIDDRLPSITLRSSLRGYETVAGRKREASVAGRVLPVVRSKLHGHCGITAFDPRLVEHVPVASAFQRYPVSCGTDAQAKALVEAFSRSEALRDPSDPRSVVFTMLPGHGCVIAEKWVSGTEPLETIWRLLDSGALRVDFASVPQGPYDYVPEDDLRVLKEKD